MIRGFSSVLAGSSIVVHILSKECTHKKMQNKHLVLIELFNIAVSDFDAKKAAR